VHLAKKLAFADNVKLREVIFLQKVSILGSGNGARACSAQIAAKGYTVVMWEPLEGAKDYLRLRETKQIFLEGDLNLCGNLHDVTMDIAEAVRGASIIMVVVPAFAHAPIFEKLIPYLEDGQHIVVMPGNFSAYRLKKMMAEAGCKTHITISTTETMPFACRIKTFNTVSLYKRKYAIHLASSPSSSRTEIREILNDAFAGNVNYLPADHILVQDLSNANYVMHPYPVLLNYGTVEKNPDTFRHYMDGITPLISEQMHNLDEERVMIGRKMGFCLKPILELMKLYYGNNNAQTLYEYVNSPETPYADLVGQNVRSRYITEDVPGVIMPIACLARKAGALSPRSDTIINLASQLHGTDYWKNGTTLESIGIANKNINEILTILE
jgi:opine dehydrogenase